MTSNRLPTLAAQINRTHDAAAAAIKRGIGYALDCGAALIEAKALVPHGQWADWLATNTALSERSAQRYMQLCRERPALEAKTATVADLTIRGACDLIAKPPEKLSEVIKCALFVPDDGCSLLGVARSPAGTDFIIITPSNFVEYYYVTHIWVSDAEDEAGLSRDVTMTALRRPARWQGLPEVVPITAGIDLSGVTWQQQRYTGPVDRNPWQIADEDGALALWEAFFPDKPPVERTGRAWPTTRKELRQALRGGT